MDLAVEHPVPLLCARCKAALAEPGRTRCSNCIAARYWQGAGVLALVMIGIFIWLTWPQASGDSATCSNPPCDLDNGYSDEAPGNY